MKSDLGVSPITAIPYAATCVFGFEIGRMTIVFHTLLVGTYLGFYNKHFGHLRDRLLA